MIEYGINSQQAADLEGRIIFHLVKGADISSILVARSSVSIGKRLGKVTRVAGPFRIFYMTADGSEKYVSAGGIGYVCDTEEEAKALEALRDETAEKIRSFVATVHAELESRLESLISDKSSS